MDQKPQPTSVVDELKQHSETLHKNTNTLFKIVLGLFLAIVLCQSIYIIILKHDQVRERAAILDNFTKVAGGFELKPGESDDEQYYKFYKFAIRVMGTFGKTYDKYNPHAIPPEQQADYIKFLWEGSKLMKMRPYRVFTIHQMESCFDPWSHNTNSGLYERGIGQQCLDAVLTAEAYLDFLPPDLKKYFQFTYKSPEDLFDWKTASKITFVLLYKLDRQFNGREEWADSVYHWGGFLERRWDNGRGTIPDTFTFERGGKPIKYRVIGYWTVRARLEAAYERGDLEYGVYVYKQYEDQTARLMKEEISLRNAKRIVGKLKIELEKERALKEAAIVQRSDLEKTIQTAYKELNIVYNDAAKQPTGEKIRVELRKYKDVVYKVIHKMTLDELDKRIWKETQLLFYIIAGIIWLIFCLILFVIQGKRRQI